MARAIKTLDNEPIAATTDVNGRKLELGIDPDNKLRTIGGRPVLAERAQRDFNGNEFVAYYAAKSELPKLTQDGVEIKSISITTENT